MKLKNKYFVYNIIVFLVGIIAYVYFSIDSDYSASIYEAGINAKFIVAAVALVLLLIGKLADISIKNKISKKQSSGIK